MNAYEAEVKAQARITEQAMVVQEFHEQGYTKEERDYLSICIAQAIIETCTEDELSQGIEMVEKLYWRSTTVNSSLTFRHVDTFANAAILATRKQIGGEKGEKRVRRIKDARNAAENARRDNADTMLW